MVKNYKLFSQKKTNAWKYLLLWETTVLWYYISKSCQKNTVWITSNALKCLVLCLQIAPWHEMCFAAVIKVHQSLGWGKIQTGKQRKKSWVQIVDLPRVRWSQILFVLHCLTEALSKKYTQAKFAACINKLNVTGVSCLHQQWICLPGFKWFLHSLMSEHKTMLITGSKLTNYASFPFLAPEVGGRLLVLRRNLLPWFVSCGSGTGGSLWSCAGRDGCKDSGSLPKSREIPLARAMGAFKLENTNELWGCSRGGEEMFYSLSLDWVRLGALGCCFSLLMHMPQPLALHCLFRSVLGIFWMDCSKACPYFAFL